jgi:hypothetical protein
MKIPFPTKAKITALVWSGRTLPKVVKGRPKLAAGKYICTAANNPTNMPTTPHNRVAKAKFFTIRLS